MKTLFISSTFRDMQYERDAIRDIVIPEINLYFNKNNIDERVDCCDLRWGIDADDDTQSLYKILDICLDGVEICDQPLIVILGDRYGWIPIF